MTPPQTIAPGSVVEAEPGAHHAFVTGGAPVVFTVPPAGVDWRTLICSAFVAALTAALTAAAHGLVRVPPAPAAPTVPPAGTRTEAEKAPADAWRRFGPMTPERAPAGAHRPTPAEPLAAGGGTGAADR